MDDLTRRLDSLVRTTGLAGAVIGTVRGTERRTAAAGAANLATGEPMTADTPVRIASLTKPLTAAATVLAGGKPSELLDRRVLSVLPELAADWRAAPDLTIGQLLGQVSGLRTGLDLEALAGLGEDETALTAACRLVARLGQEDAPGSVWRYYNGNYYLAGAALAALTGRPYEAALAAMVLDPAGMTATGFATPAHHAEGHHRGATLPAEEYPRSRRPSGGLWSTVDDLLRFTDFVLSDATLLAAVREPGPAPGTAIEYGLGWALAGGFLFHNGRLDGFRSMLVMAPEHRFAVAMVANDTDALPEIADFIDSVLPDDDAAPTARQLMF